VSGGDSLTKEHRDDQHPSVDGSRVDGTGRSGATTGADRRDVDSGDDPADGEVAARHGERNDLPVPGVLSAERSERAADPECGDDGDDDRGTPEQGGAG